MYKLLYNLQTGQLSCIVRLSDNACIPLCKDNIDYQEFLKWNKAQETPLDLNSTIEPVKPEPVRDLARELDDLKAKVAVLETKVK